MHFNPIMTPFCRLAIVPTDMPINSPHDIPNTRIYMRNNLGVVAIPYKITGLTRTGAGMGRVAAAIEPLIVAQMERRDIIDMYGHCVITNPNGTPVKNIKKEIERVLENAMPSRTCINYRTDRIGTEKIVSNYLLLSVANGLDFRSWTTEKEFLAKNSEEERASRRASQGNSEIHGTCTIFGIESYCTLRHEFFDLNRFTIAAWEEHVTKRVFEAFPFMQTANLFSDLKFSLDL